MDLRTPINPESNFLELLVSKGLIKKELKPFLVGKTLAEIADYLIKYKVTGIDDLKEIYCDYFKLPLIDLGTQQPQTQLKTIISKEIAEQFMISPIRYDNGILYLAVAEPWKLQAKLPQALDSITKSRGISLQLTVAESNEQIKQFNDKLYNVVAATPTMPSVQSTNSPASANQEMGTLPIPQQVQENKPTITQNYEDDRPLYKKDAAEKSGYHDMPEVDLKKLVIPRQILNKIPQSVAEKYRVIVFGQTAPKGEMDQAFIKIAIIDPQDAKVMEMLAFIEKKNNILVERYKTDEESIKYALDLYNEETTTNPISEDKTAKEEFDSKPLEKEPEKEPIKEPDNNGVEFEESVGDKIDKEPTILSEPHIGAGGKPHSHDMSHIPAPDEPIELTESDIAFRPEVKKELGPNAIE